MEVTFEGLPSNTTIRLSWFITKTGDNISSGIFTSSTTTIAPAFNRDLITVLKPE